MNYIKIYNSLVERGKNRKIEGYTENHHIIPRCMGGSDDKENLVRLTPEEHYLAHQLLVKIYPKNQALVRAAAMMIPNRPSNKMYGWLRREFIKVQSSLQEGSRNSQYGTIWITNGKESKKIPGNEEVSDGWQFGRTIESASKCKIPIFKKISLCRSCVKIEKKIPIFNKISMCIKCTEDKQKETAIYWYNEFINSRSESVRDFVRSSSYDKSHVSFIKMLKKYIPDFRPEKGKKYKTHGDERRQGCLA